MLETIESILKFNDWPKILLLFGEEDFLLEEAFNKIITHVTSQGQNRYDFETFDGDGSDSEKILDRITDSCIAYPFVSEKRIVAVRNFDSLFSSKSKKNNDNNSFSKYLANPQDTTFLILTAGADQLAGLYAAMKDKKSSSKAQKIISSAKYPFNILIDKYSWIEFPKITEAGYSGWIKRRLSHFGYSITDAAAEMLVAHTAQSLRDLSNQLDKLILYCKDNKNITEDEVSGVSGFSRVFNVFELQKAVGRKNLHEALNIAEKMLQTESQEILITTILTRYFTSLWKLSEARMLTSDKFQLAGKAGLSPYFIGEYIDALNKYSVRDIELSFGHLVEADESLKSSSTDGKFVIQKMLINLMS